VDTEKMDHNSRPDQAKTVSKTASVKTRSGGALLRSQVEGLQSEVGPGKKHETPFNK
jgi:hypothetical protein